MTQAITDNTKAVLLLTAPLISGKTGKTEHLLTLGEYNVLAQFLRERQHSPRDLLGNAREAIVRDLSAWLLHDKDVHKRLQNKILQTDGLSALLARGMLLAQVLEDWQNRAIRVISRADGEYPSLLKKRLREQSPVLLYACGNLDLAHSSALAVVGSRHADADMLDYAHHIGALAARAGCSIVSGGAKGIDDAAMHGALSQGGWGCAVLADHLAKAALQANYRDALAEGRLLLLSPYDPQAGFSAGNAMQRNKLIYALTQAALVVNADKGKGGTWAGAIEQLDKYRFAPLYVRKQATSHEALDALRHKGAFIWPDPDVENFTQIFHFSEKDNNVPQGDLFAASTHSSEHVETVVAERFFGEVRRFLLDVLKTPCSKKEITEKLGVTTGQMSAWLEKLLDEGVIHKQKGRGGKYVANPREI